MAISFLREAFMRARLMIAAILLMGASALAEEVEVERGTLKIALVSMKSLYTDGADAKENAANLKTNLDRHFYFINKAVAKGANFVGFPECSLTGYHFSENTTWLSRTSDEVLALAAKAKEKRIYIGFGYAQKEKEVKSNRHVVMGPDGRVAGWHHKIWVTNEKNFVEAGTDHNVFDVNGIRMGIATSSDGTDYQHLKLFSEYGTQILYAPHANISGGTIAGWYKFREEWAGTWDGKTRQRNTAAGKVNEEIPTGGWMSGLRMRAIMVNAAGLYSPSWDPPVKNDENMGFASGIWMIGMDGKTIAQQDTSNEERGSRETMLIKEIKLGGDGR
jgi:hypothetical protein